MHVPIISLDALSLRLLQTNAIKLGKCDNCLLVNWLRELKLSKRYILPILLFAFISFTRVTTLSFNSLQEKSYFAFYNFSFAEAFLSS